MSCIFPNQSLLPYQMYSDFYICGGKFGLISGDIFLLRSVRYARNCRFPKKGGLGGWVVRILKDNVDNIYGEDDVDGDNKRWI